MGCMYRSVIGLGLGAICNVTRALDVDMAQPYEEKQFARFKADNQV
jgi:hypothetical protein